MQFTKRKAAALVVAGVVAFMAVGTGGAVAARLITGAQIEDGTITQADINDATEAALKGQKGDPGTPGTNGTNGVTGLTTVVSADTGTAQADSIASTDAICPSGKKAVGGGWELVGIDQTIEDFLAYTDNPIDNNNAWRVTVYNVDANHDNTGSVRFKAYAVCANVN